MDELKLLRAILDSYSTPIVFVDDGYVIRYMNKYARNYYCGGQENCGLIGKSIFDCHREEKSRKFIADAFEDMKKDGKDRFVGADEQYRVYMQPVSDEDGKVFGFFERFEINVVK